MKVADIPSRLDEMRGDEDPTNSLKIITAKVGDVAESEMRAEAVDDQDRIDAVRRDLVGGLVVAAGEYAAEHDIDLDEAVDGRLSRMETAKDRRDEVTEAIEDEDAEALADAVRGGDGDDDDFGDERGVY